MLPTILDQLYGLRIVGDDSQIFLSPNSICIRDYGVSFVMVTTTGPIKHRVVLSLLILSLLPLLSILLWFNYAAVILYEQRLRLSRRQNRKHAKRTILITGTDNVFGLNLARAFSKAGYRVVGADLAFGILPSVANLSRAITVHYDLPQLSAVQQWPYIARSIFAIARKENASFWIDFSDNIDLNAISEAKADLERSTSCRCFAYDYGVGTQLENKANFFQFLKDNNLPSLEYHKVASRGQIHKILNQSQGQKKYLLTVSEGSKPFNPRTLLPQRTLSQTYNEVAKVKIAAESQMVLEESNDTSVTYECFSIAVKSEMQAFLAKSSAARQEIPLSEDSALFKAMKSYTAGFVKALGSTFTGQFVLSFGLSEKITQAGVVQQILPLQCNFELDAQWLLSFPHHVYQEMIVSYAGTTEQDFNGITDTNGNSHNGLQLTTSPTNGNRAKQQYLILQELDDLLDSATKVSKRRASLVHLLKSLVITIRKIATWHEAFYEFDDPVPAFFRWTLIFLWETPSSRRRPSNFRPHREIST